MRPKFLPCWVPHPPAQGWRRGHGHGRKHMLPWGAMDCPGAGPRSLRTQLGLCPRRLCSDLSDDAGPAGAPARLRGAGLGAVGEAAGADAGGVAEGQGAQWKLTQVPLPPLLLNLQLHLSRRPAVSPGGSARRARGPESCSPPGLCTVLPTRHAPPTPRRRPLGLTDSNPDVQGVPRTLPRARPPAISLQMSLGACRCHTSSRTPTSTSSHGTRGHVPRKPPQLRAHLRAREPLWKFPPWPRLQQPDLSGGDGA